jgi:hypothetical protein
VIVGPDVVVVDLVQDEVRCCRSAGGAARRLCRETGSDHEREHGRDDENVP